MNYESTRETAEQQDRSVPCTRFLGWILAACLVAFLSLACYGMLLGEARVLDFVMTLIRDGVIGTLGWFLGHHRSL